MTNTDNNTIKKPLILVADDDITVRMIARECLEESGFDVEEAGNGSEAVERATQLQPDAVMLDVLMPEMDGYTACRSIRAMTGNEHLPILMMTALDDVDSIHAAYDAGASEFVTKPVNWTIESHRLRNMLRAAASAKQVYIAKLEWERTFNALDEVVTILDTDKRIIQANDAALRAARNPLSTILGRKCCDVFCHDAQPNKTCPLEDVLESAEKKVVERVNECMAGTFQISVFPILSDEGEVVRMVYMAKDITERQQLEAEVRRAQKMDAVGTLAGGLAHDFKNLLQMIIGYSELISIKFKPEDSVYQYIDAIKESAWRGNEITQQLMTVSRKVESRKQPLQLNMVIRNVSKLLESTLPKMIYRQTELTDDLWLVNADPVQIEQVLMNLAVNAGHAMPHGGSLVFQTRNVELGRQYCRTHPNVQPGAYVMLSITDTGCGMDKTTLTHIYEPFFTTRSPDLGTGMGLAMVYGIVQKHNGHLVCYSEVAEGSTFKIYLPAIAHSVNNSAERVRPEVLTLDGTECVLFVDDEPGIRNVAKKVLSAVGYRVVLAANGQEAVDLYDQEEAIDFVILDLNMPVMGGIECLDRLHEMNPDLPVLLASGFALNHESEKRLCERVDYISKPYHEKEFLVKIRELLERGARSEQQSCIS